MSNYIISGRIQLYENMFSQTVVKEIPFAYCCEAYGPEEAIEYAELWAQRCHPGYDAKIYEVKVITDGEYD